MARIVSCGISNLPIEKGDNVVIFILREESKNNPYSAENYFHPVCMPISASFDGTGFTKIIRTFNTKLILDRYNKSLSNYDTIVKEHDILQKVKSFDSMDDLITAIQTKQVYDKNSLYDQNHLEKKQLRLMIVKDEFYKEILENSYDIRFHGSDKEIRETFDTDLDIIMDELLMSVVEVMVAYKSSPTTLAKELDKIDWKIVKNSVSARISKEPFAKELIELVRDSMANAKEIPFIEEEVTEYLVIKEMMNKLGKLWMPYRLLLENDPTCYEAYIDSIQIKEDFKTGFVI